MAKTASIHQLKADEPLTGLDLLRKPFEAHQISKLPKPTKRQTEEVKADYRKGIRCNLCGAWHHPDVVHLDYVGHAALTDRLLDCDPEWNWEPVSAGPNGEPVLDENGGMWIRLTVCGVTRMGYGHPDGKRGGDAIKETIGDCLRNAAMRFGAALDLWHKGVLHEEQEADAQPAEPAKPKAESRDDYSNFEGRIREAGSQTVLKGIWQEIEAANMSGDWQDRLAAEIDDRLAELKKPKPAAKAPAASLDDQFPGELPKDEHGYTAADYANQL